MSENVEVTITTKKPRKPRTPRTTRKQWTESEKINLLEKGNFKVLLEDKNPNFAVVEIEKWEGRDRNMASQQKRRYERLGYHFEDCGDYWKGSIPRDKALALVAQWDKEAKDQLPDAGKVVSGTEYGNMTREVEILRGSDIISKFGVGN